MKFEEVPMFDIPTAAQVVDENALQWRLWRNRCPLRRLMPNKKQDLATDMAQAGGWHDTLERLGRGLLLEIPNALAARMKAYDVGVRTQLDMERTPLLETMREWLAQRPDYPWQPRQ